MGIIADAAAILLGAIVGRIFKSKAVFGQTDIFGVGIIIISIAGVIENLFWISDGKIKGEGVLAVVAALIVGYIIGELLKIEERITKIPSEKRKLGGFVDAAVFFGIGGLQICGPILLGAQNDSTQLYIKSIIDFPFAVMFGAIYGASAAFAALPVAAIQAAIATGAHFFGDFTSAAAISLISAIGYVILFFSGFNMLSVGKKKISAVNMLPAVPLVILFGAIIPI